MPEKNKPTLTLVGNNPFVIELGETYLDPGASAVDAKGVTISERIDKRGNVNNHKLGNYSVAYWASDKIKNQSDTLRRTVIVKLNARSLVGYYFKNNTSQGLEWPSFDVIKSESGDSKNFFFYSVAGLDSMWVNAVLSGDYNELITVPAQNIIKSGLSYEISGSGKADEYAKKLDLTFYRKLNGVTDTIKSKYTRVE